MDKFLKIKCDELMLRLCYYYSSKKPDKSDTPLPVLWNYNGFYGWIPVEIFKNEMENAIINNSFIEFSWQQAFPLRQDVGKILEEVGNEN